MNEEELQAIRERAEKATPGPWQVEPDIEQSGYYVVMQDGHPVAHWWGDNTSDDAADVAFLAHAREDIPALLAEVERLKQAFWDEHMGRTREYNEAGIDAEIAADSSIKLEAQNAAMREIVQAVADARWGSYPSGEHLFGIDDAMALKLKARAILDK